ncbi:DUF1097 domain-containing protein [Sphingomonas colocasiae]|uniref:DUF1097 domain-containing protein n=1 Tax=Sphingomonas colocasiae TaxID=1848973 RepID=A0ABS7PIF8_9SPHN|nr:DUF1097 domain-containing protein [Sphingomonas colocasiae]MBY8820744.1 DUF1097 domain-containing protein [Sphingomonas colocasiae]
MKNVLALAVTALVAAVSSVICARLGIPVWSMFIGWIAFVAGGMSARTAAPTFVCAILGLVLGFVGASIIGGGAAALGGDIALLLGVFVIVFAALLAQFVPFASLVVCYFIGMTTFFASGLPPTAPTALVLGSGLLAGVLSGLLAVILSGVITRGPAAETT